MLIFDLRWNDHWQLVDYLPSFALTERWKYSTDKAAISRFALKCNVCPSSWRKRAPPGCFIATELNRLIMHGYYHRELRKFHSVGKGSPSLSLSLATWLSLILAAFPLFFFLRVLFGCFQPLPASCLSPVHCLCFSFPVHSLFFLPPAIYSSLFPGLCHSLFHTRIH